MNALVGLGIRKKLHGLGFLLQGAWARSVSETTTAGATGFSLQAMLYVGKARLFTYNDVNTSSRVTVRHEKNVSPGLSRFLDETRVGQGPPGSPARWRPAIEIAADAVASAIGTGARGALQGVTGVGWLPQSTFMAAIRAAEAQAADIRELEADAGRRPGQRDPGEHAAWLGAVHHPREPRAARRTRRRRAGGGRQDDHRGRVQLRAAVGRRASGNRTK